MLKHQQGKGAAVVGNEDGAHWSSSQLFQYLNDTGWTIPANAACYWVGEAMGSKNFKDLEQTPDAVTKAAKDLCRKCCASRSLASRKQVPWNTLVIS